MEQATNLFKKFARNSFFSSISEISIIFLFSLLVLAARYLGDEAFGVFSFALAFVSIFSVINDCGLRYVYVREVSRDKTLSEYYLSNILLLQFFLSVLGLVLIVIIINLMDKTLESRLVVYILAVAEAVRSVKMLFRFVFRSLERFELEAITTCVERIMLLAFGVVVLILGYGVLSFAFTFLVVRIFDVVVTFSILRGLFSPSLKFELFLWSKLVRQGLPFIMTGITILLLYRVDTLMLSAIKNDVEVGWYNAAYKLIEGLLLFPAILGNSLFPTMSQACKDSNLVILLYRRGVKYVLLVSIPLSIIGSLFADKLVLFVFGQEYANSVVVLKILLWSSIFTFTYYIGGVVLAAIDKQRITFYVSCLVLILNVTLNAVLIPKMGYVGAAVTTVISAFIFCLSVSLYLSFHGYKVLHFKMALKPVIAATIMAAIVMVCPDPSGLVMPLSVIGYFAIVTLLSFWDEEEILLIRKMLNSVSRYSLTILL